MKNVINITGRPLTQAETDAGIVDLSQKEQDHIRSVLARLMDEAGTDIRTGNRFSLSAKFRWRVATVTAHLLRRAGVEKALVTEMQWEDVFLMTALRNANIETITHDT